MKRWMTVVLAGLALTLVGCSAPPSEAFGLSLSSQGTVELRFGRCLGGWDIWVRPAGDEAARSVWALREDRGSGRAAGHLPPVILVGGETPKGWREVTKLRHPLESGVRYTVHVGSGEWYQEFFDFTVDELKPGYVLDFTHNFIASEEFPTESACPTKSPSSTS